VAQNWVSRSLAWFGCCKCITKEVQAWMVEPVFFFTSPLPLSWGRGVMQCIGVMQWGLVCDFGVLADVGYLVIAFFEGLPLPYGFDGLIEALVDFIEGFEDGGL